ncbi:RTA1-domain-containing protein [Glonium stellatum]|uniref:RTA1-domain-containing protein n=1 Tax=Glonium stellatum TaxID=574774 RepID=A0A8E2JMR9_9PEZI|nr:RTA1-domain-containing protein [Glonium stellatum]
MTAFTSHLLPRAPGKYANCTMETCPIKFSIYGYNPSKPANIAFCAIFGLSLIAHIIQGIRWKSWSFLIVMSIGIFGEAVGYVGRILMHNNVFNANDFKIQIICLTVAPAFLAAGVYLTLKHTVIVFGAHLSRIRPNLYTRIFVGCDIASITIQAVGAGIAAQGTHTTAGNDIMILGLSSQVVTLAIFGVMASEYAFRVYKFKDRLNPATTELRRSFYFKGMVVAIAIAFTTILVRCIYRVAEMAGGWRNSLMQDQALFIALDSVMCSLAVISLNIFHPGFLFQESKAVDKGRQVSDAQVPMT